MYRIVIAEEQPLTRHAIRNLLEQEGHEVVEEAADGMDALHRALELKPDILILALRLKRLGGLEVIKRLRQHGADTRVLVLTAQDSGHFISMCLQEGAAGFVSKTDDLGDLVQAVEAVGRGRTFFPSSVLEFTGTDPATQAADAQIQTLSPREMTVLNYLAAGRSNREIAQALILSDRTVSTYKIRLMRKLNVSSLIELAEVAKRHNVLGPGQSAEAESNALQVIDEQNPHLTKTILDAIPSPVTIRDLTGTVLFANAYLRSTFTLPGREVMGSNLDDLGGLFDLTQVAAVKTAFADAVQEARPYSCEVAFPGKDGTKAVLHWGAPILNEQSELIAMVCGSQNISSLERGFQKLRQAKEHAQAASKAKSVLLGQTDWQLGEPVQLIGELLQQLQTDRASLPLATQEVLGKTRDALLALRTRLTNLELLVQAEGDDQGLLAVRTPLHGLTVELLESWRNAASQRGLDLQLAQSGTGMQQDQVWLDQRCYVGIMNALMRHAVATTSGTGTLHVQLHSTLQSRAMLDMQLDISIDTADAIWLDQPDQDHASMLLCRQLVERLDGRLNLHGQQISMWLPLPRALDEPAP